MRSLLFVIAVAACDARVAVNDGNTVADDTPPLAVDASPDAEAAVHTILAAGDIASSDPHDRDTAELVASLPGTVIVVGDNAYNSGTLSEFMTYYEPTWGQFKDRTKPAPGNHEYRTSNAGGYFQYFGAAAGAVGKGYYSYDIGDWHIVALNTNGEDACATLSCSTGSTQEQWLRADLAAHAKPCTLAYWHHPRWSSGSHGSDARVQALWKALHDAGAEIVITGHDHDYERMKPLDANGAVDETTGLVQFVVGTGGRDLRSFDDPPLAVTARRNASTWGVLRLDLYADRAKYKFVPIEGQTFTDEGEIACH